MFMYLYQSKNAKESQQKETLTKFRDEIPFWKSKAAAVAHVDSLKLNPCF